MGHFVEVKQRPKWKSVDNYKDHIKKEAPNIGLKHEFLGEEDIICTCCKQKAPHVAAALLKVEDQTPVRQKFTNLKTEPGGDQGAVVWICADCFFSGVRPKYTYFGDIKWNKQGRRIKKRAEETQGSPW